MNDDKPTPIAAGTEGQIVVSQLQVVRALWLPVPITKPYIDPLDLIEDIPGWLR